MTLLDELDRVNSHHARNTRNHWTHARDLPKTQGYDKYKEGGQCNFLALTIQAHLIKYAHAKTLETLHCMNKDGIPLLDHALRALRLTYIAMPYHSTRHDPSVDVEMVKLILTCHAHPNEQVILNNGETVWVLFLIYIETADEVASGSLVDAWFQVCVALIRAGAAPDYIFVNKHFRNRTVLDVIDGDSETRPRRWK